MSPMDLSGNYKLAVALVGGMIFGFMLIKSGLTDTGRVRKLFQLRDGGMLVLVLTGFVSGALLFYLAGRAGMARVHAPEASLWSSLAGGVVSGVGIVAMGMIPVAALAALAGGRMPALAAIAGMLLAFPAVSACRRVLPGIFDAGASLGASPPPTHFWTVGNPCLWVILAGAVMLIVVHFAAGDGE